MVVDLIGREIAQMKSSCELVQLETIGFKHQRLLVLIIHFVCFQVVARLCLSGLGILDPDLVAHQCVVKHIILALSKFKEKVAVQILLVDTHH